MSSRPQTDHGLSLLLAFLWLIVTAATGEAAPSSYGPMGVRRWPNHTVPVTVVLGGLSSSDRIRLNSAVSRAFGIWSAVEGVRLNVQFEAPWEIPVDSYEEYLALLADPTPNVFVIFDARTDLLRALAKNVGIDNLGARDAWTFEPPGYATDPDLSKMFVLIDGARQGLADQARLFTLLVHEAGHALGLDHSALRYEAARDNASNDHAFVPVMSPFVRHVNLQPDDVVWISSLYGPGLDRNYVWVRGTVVDRDKRPVWGVQVRAIRLDTTPSEIEQYSFVTLIGDEGPGYPEGFFELPVPAGRYAIRIEQIPTDPPVFDLWREGKRRLPQDRPRIMAYQHSVIQVSHHDLGQVLVTRTQ